MKFNQFASLVTVLGCAFGYGFVACGGGSNTDDDTVTGGGGNGGSKAGGKGGSGEGGKGGSPNGGSGGKAGAGGGGTGGTGGTPESCPPTSGGLNVTEGLVGHWRFDGDTKDSTGKNDGTFVRGSVADAPAATPTFTCGKRGQAIFLNNPDFINPYWVRVPSSVSLNSIQTAFTITLWARMDGFDSNPDDWNFLVSRHESGTRYERFGVGTLSGRLASSVKTQGATSPDVIPLDGKFHHVAVTYDDLEGNRVYIDGMVSDETNPLLTIAQDTTNLIIGANQNVDLIKEGWYGAIDDVKLYSVVLTPAQIATDAQ